MGWSTALVCPAVSALFPLFLNGSVGVPTVWKRVSPLAIFNFGYSRRFVRFAFVCV